MLSKNELKYYSSLLIKKFRVKENKFIIEGKKIIEEAIQSKYNCEIIIITNEFAQNGKSYLGNIRKNIRIEIIKNSDFQKLKDTVSPQGIIAVFNKTINKKKKVEKIKDDLLVCLDNVSDPGNLGTIMRNCDWFGFSKILLTKNCAELFNPKTIRASMGSVFHLNIMEDINQSDITNLKNKGYKIFCSDLNGEDLYSVSFSKNSVLVFSNEANGPSQEILELADKKITIPSYGKAESLNVASASAVMLSHIRKIII
jgi:TrmH family RNA methyltransferase